MRGAPYVPCAAAWIATMRSRNTRAAKGCVSSTHDSRWGRRPEHGTSWPPDERPGSRSRIGILRRYRLRLPSEPGGSARENVALHFELAVLTPQTLEFLALGRGQPVRTPTLVPVSLCHPVADRLRSRLELPL